MTPEQADRADAYVIAHLEQETQALTAAVRRVLDLCDNNDGPNERDIHVPGFVRVDDLRRTLRAPHER